MNITQLLLAMLCSFAITAVSGLWVIPILKKLRFGQTILDIGPSWHKKKQGTPTMGGIMFIFSIVVTFLLFSFGDIIKGDTRALWSLLFALACGTIGFFDDYTKITKKANRGISPRQKLILLSIAAVAYLFAMYAGSYISTALYIPFLNFNIELSFFYFIFCAVLIVGIVNAVNLTDGIDGLCASVTVPIALFFLMAFQFLRIAGSSILAAALIGGLLGFLVYNFYPAKVFMGDTGSLFMGGIICGMAFSYNQPALLFIVGLIFIIEAASVIIQVGVYKLTGKRVFKMAPIHHHFEKSGWSEIKIVISAFLITLLLCAVSLISVANYYIY